jgi:transcriptional antiterminator Rof (Rho-off)
MTTDYRPIACGLYDQLEVWASHAEPLQLDVRDPQGQTQRLFGVARDLRIRTGAEYLVIEDPAGKRHELRLDRLSQICSRRDGLAWRRDSDALWLER